MKYLAFILILLTPPLLGQSLLKVSALHTGENRYVQNPYSIDFVHFCTDSIKINDGIYNTNLNSSAIKLDLNSLKIPLGEMVNVSIYHKDSCRPKFLNPMSSPKTSKIRFDSLKLDKDGVLSWKCYNDSVGSRPPLIIEQLKSNRWAMVSEVNQNWDAENYYSTKVNFSPGTNKFRINGYSSISDTVYFTSTIKPVKYKLSANNQMFIFEDSILFELQNENGFMYFRREGQNVDITRLRNGNYQICYDNEIIKFSIRRKKIHLLQQ